MSNIRIFSPLNFSINEIDSKCSPVNNLEPICTQRNLFRIILIQTKFGLTRFRKDLSVCGCMYILTRISTNHSKPKTKGKYNHIPFNMKINRNTFVSVYIIK